MATDSNSVSSPTDAELLHVFLGQRIANGGRDASIDELLGEFSEYRRQLESLRASLRIAEEQSARGESTRLDLEAIFESVHRRIAEQGGA